MNDINQWLTVLQSKTVSYHVLLHYQLLHSHQPPFLSRITREEGMEKNISQFMIGWLVEVEDHLRKMLFTIEIIIYKFGIKKYFMKEGTLSVSSQFVTTKCINL